MTVAFLGFGASPGGGEIFLVLLVTLLLFGSRRLPGLARAMGRALASMRKASEDVRRELLWSHDEELQQPSPGEKASAERRHDGESNAS